MTKQTKPQHTPGPKFVQQHLDEVKRRTFYNDEPALVDVNAPRALIQCQGVGQVEGINWMLRQPLYAAAPDLLEQLKAWNTWAETLPGGVEQFEKFARKQDNWADAPVLSHTRAAIAKAKEGK